MTQGPKVIQNNHTLNATILKQNVARVLLGSPLSMRHASAWTTLLV